MGISVRLASAASPRAAKLAGLLVCLLLPVAASGQMNHKFGDTDGNGCVDSVDSANMDAAFLGGGVPPPESPCPAAYDYDHDGYVFTGDMLAFLDDYLYENVACRPDQDPPNEYFGCLTYPPASCDVVCQPLCNVPDNGSGTAELPPAGCPYLSPGKFHRIVDSLPPGTELQVSVEHRGFTNITRTPGGSLGGEIEQFDSEVRLQIQGTGLLQSYQRVVVLEDAPVEIHTAPKQPGQPVQELETDMRSLVAEITPADGDPDFELLRITAGTDLGMPSPGVTKLVESNSFDTLSRFNVSYQVEMIGAAGGPLAGYSSTTTGVLEVGTPGTPLTAGIPAMGGVGIAVAAALLAGLGVLGWRWKAGAVDGAR